MKDVVTIGASAGGVAALSALMPTLPPDLAAAVLVVLHMPTEQPSHLAAVLDRLGPLPAAEAHDGERIETGRVYVAPANHHLLVANGRLRLTQGPRENRVRPCIDTLFRSAAVELGPRAVGVVLSGVLDDGTAGLWAIKDRGGTAIAQDPNEAEFPDMPESAIKHVEVDHVLPTARIGACLAALAREPTPPLRTPSPRLAAETRIDLQGDALRRGVLNMGTLSPNTCPECHGTLIEIREGNIVRYRCHAGHAYTLRSLLEDTHLAIENSLWNAVRAVEERSFLLRRLAAQARDRDEAKHAAALEADADRDERNAQALRKLIVESAAKVA